MAKDNTIQDKPVLFSTVPTNISAHQISAFLLPTRDQTWHDLRQGGVQGVGEIIGVVRYNRSITDVHTGWQGLGKQDLMGKYVLVLLAF